MPSDELKFARDVAALKIKMQKYEDALREIAAANNPSRVSGCPQIAKDALGDALYQPSKKPRVR